MERNRIVYEGEAELDVLHLLRGVFAIPGVERLRAAFRVGHQERQLAGADDRKTSGLIAGIDVSEIGNAVTRHVVVVECLAELLGRIDLGLDRKSTRLNSSHLGISYAVFCLTNKK